jgi:hypothetical protein
VAMTAMGRRDREVVDPSAVAVVPRHDGRDQFVADGADHTFEDFLWIDRCTVDAAVRRTATLERSGSCS